MLTDSNFSASKEKQTLFTKKINKISVNLRFKIIRRHFNFFMPESGSYLHVIFCVT